MTNSKLQYALITQLQKHGQVEILLPDGVVLEIGITQVAADGELVSTDNYCWVIATRGDRSMVLDSYNMGLRYPNDSSTILYEDEFVTAEGDSIKRLDVV